jgi:hypothetical protein
MRPNTTSSPARRDLRAAERRSRRRPALLAAGLAFGLVAAAGASITVPAPQAQASLATEGFVLASYSAPLQPVVARVTGDASITDARDAIAAAEESISAAATVASDIEQSGLDVGVDDTTVDTDELESAVERLELADRLPAELVPAFIDEVTELVAAVDADVNGLRGSLDAAIALKAEQEAAEKAKREAEAAAAAAAAAAEAAAAKSSAPSAGSSAPVFAGPGTSAGEAQAIARNMIAGYGWGDDQFNCLVSLWNKESGWNSQAYNASSGAFGIPQALPGSKMATAGADWQTNAATQISWGLGYISGRYGTPCGAWSHSQSVGWY